MRLYLPKPLIWSFLALFGFLSLIVLQSCDRDLTSTEDQPTVDYVLLVTDSVTATPLQEVKIRVTAINGDTSTYYTDRFEGRAELETMASSRTLFVLSKEGYRTLDVLDTVNAKPDTVFNRPVQRLLRLKMAKTHPDSGRVQAKLFLRDADLEKILGGVVTLIDSLGGERTFGDNDSDGAVELTGLKVGKNPLKVEHPDYLGRKMEWTHEKSADTGLSVPVTTIRLMALDNRISGQVYFKTATVPLPLRDAKVEFHLKDSLAVPSKFVTYTAADIGQNGRFQFDKVPALDGELWFFRNRTSTERTKVLAITKEEVLLDGPIPLVTLTISADSLQPLLRSGPKSVLPGKDTLETGDSLVFKFNQPVGQVRSLKVRLVNSSELLIRESWNDDRTILTIKQRDAGWSEGKKYEYELSLVNDQGEAFSIPGDSSQLIQGGFDVRVKTGSQGGRVAVPKDIRLTYFNSGNHYQFGPADTNTSPKADSTSEFARLKWTWDTTGRRVDSLVIYFQDNRSNTSWTRWGALPGFLDSAYLAFSEKYSTVNAPSQKARFPLRDSGGSVTFRIRPKHEGRELDDEDTTLAAMEQGMGPTVYAVYSSDPVSDSGGVKDTVKVTFQRRSGRVATDMVWGPDAPTPKVYDDWDAVYSKTWAWDPDGKTGYLIYTLPTMVIRAPHLRVDLNGVLYQGKPIWQRNSQDVKVIE